MGEGSSESESESGSHTALSLRFLGLLKQPGAAADAPDLDPELDESDVVWSSDNSSSSPCSVSSPPVVNFPAARRRAARAFAPGSFGLSALLESGNDGGSGVGPIRRQSSPITPSVAVPIARSSPAPHKAFNQSAPVAVPVWPGRTGEGRNGRVDSVWGFEEDEEEGEIMGRIDEDDMEEMVPPHVIVARSHMTSFSVLEGAGRTLKGRDLRRVRNAVLEKTGFLDV